nr:protein phosphatase 2C domain-containing protein [Leifsonia psychrotolerans]
MTLDGARAQVSFGARSDVGAVRKVNEDSFLAAAPVFLVADGMGGHARGDEASRTAVGVFEEHIEVGAPSTPERILDAIHSSNDAVADLHTGEDVGSAVAGTTLAGVAFVDAGDGVGLCWMAFNIGDSRIYTWDGHQLVQLSVDHSVVQEMVDAGLLRTEDAATHPKRNVITRAIGTDDYADADVWLIPVEGRQRFLICSDGLSTELDSREIAQILTTADEVEPSAAALASAADALVEAAIARGGRDNVTVIMLESTLAPHGEVLA